MKKLIFAAIATLFIFGCAGNPARLAEKNLAAAEATIRSAKLMGAETAASAEIKKAERHYELAEENFHKEPQNRLRVYLKRKAALKKSAAQNAEIARQHAEKAIVQTQKESRLSTTLKKSLIIEIEHLKDRNQRLKKDASQIKVKNQLLRQHTDRLKAKVRTLEIEKQHPAFQGAGVTQPVHKDLLKTPGDLYRQGFYLYQTRQYDAARKIFEQYLDTYTDNLSDNAQYWIGECHYMLQQYELSLAAFESVLSKFKDSNKIPDTLLKTGLCHLHLGNVKKAVTKWQRLVDRHPKTRAARFAEKFLARQEARAS